LNTNTDLYICFRGTRGVEEWEKDATTPLVPCSFLPLGKDIKVHKGFQDVYTDNNSVDESLGSLRSQVLNFLNGNNSVLSYLNLWVTGHSLGGALATLAIIDIATNANYPGVKIMYNFASPLVGNQAFVDFFKEKIGTGNCNSNNNINECSWRVVNTNDIVPKIPPPTLDYAHVNGCSGTSVCNNISSDSENNGIFQIEFAEKCKNLFKDAACFGNAHSATTYLSTLMDIPPTPVNSSLYPFTTHTFTSAGIEGRFGPRLAQIRTAYSSIPWAERFINMTNDDGIQLWTVPVSGVYLIRTVGAGAGSNIVYCMGRDIQANVTLNRGDIIKILVGQRGIRRRFAGGGNGGTFVVTNNNQPIIIAGGGGGWSNAFISVGTNANQTTNGNNGLRFLINQIIAGIGGIDGNGANGDVNGAYSSGGGGFYTDNNQNLSNNQTLGGISFLNGGIGGMSAEGSVGGFGGGGGGSTSFGDRIISGGGGGGYSGGGGGGGDGGGGGGGSFSRGEPMIDNGATNRNSGSVVITFVR
jgi:hypothetical protein